MQGFVGLLLMLVLVLPAMVTAQETVEPDPCSPPTYRTDVRPNPKGPPTPVTIGMRVADLLDISDVDQTISIDVVMRMQWTDSRLSDWEGCRLSVENVWFPEVLLKNSGRIFKRWPENVSVESGGRVTYQQRIAGQFSTYHQLKGFPFDVLNISLWFYPLDWSSEKLIYVDDEEFTGKTPLLNISDWKINGVDAKVLEVDIEAFGQSRTAYELSVSAERYISYYLWKIMLPIALIVVMSWFVFWIDPAEFGTQIGLSATSVLTMVAFIFATTNMLPRLGYFTMLDRYIAGSTIFVFAALVQSLTTGFLVTNGNETLAQRLDQVSRFAFPIAFLVLCYRIIGDVW